MALTFQNTRQDLRYAEDEPNVERFQRVRVIKTVTLFTGYYAKAGAVGRLISFGPGTRRCILFERSSASLVKSNDLTQCTLEVDALYIEYVES